MTFRLHVSPILYRPSLSRATLWHCSSISPFSRSKHLVPWSNGADVPVVFPMFRSFLPILSALFSLPPPTVADPSVTRRWLVRCNVDFGETGQLSPFFVRGALRPSPQPSSEGMPSSPFISPGLPKTPAEYVVVDIPESPFVSSLPRLE